MWSLNLIANRASKFNKLQLAVYIVFSLFFLLPQVLQASENKDAKRILSLVDYIGGDYKNAVLGGKVINADEYTEMLDFSESARLLANNIESEKAYIKNDTALLNKLIIDKSSTEQVLELSNKIKQNLISDFNLETFPNNSPSLKLGKLLYMNSCAQCHGLDGMADGPLSEGLIPRPANFYEGDLIQGLSAFKIYNTVSFGIKGTGMPSYPKLSEEQKWNIAFYVLSIRYENNTVESEFTYELPGELKDYKLIATMSDDDIRADLGSSSYNKDQINDILTEIRSNTGFSNENKASDNEPLKLAGSLLLQSVKLYANGDKQLAYSKSIDAYLEGFEKVENKLAVKDKKLTSEIENKFSEFRAQIKGDYDVENVKDTYKELDADLTKASLLLTNTKPLGKLFSFLQSFAIIVREGLEAVLIVAAIIAFLTTTGSRKAIKYVHYGWVSALIAGLVTWMLAQTVISITSAQREIIEGATSLIAAAVLFYVSYWFITKIEVQKWKEFIQGKVKQALTKKNVLTLASVSFFAVYREAFETVLFYQALWLQAENSQSEVIWGFLIGTVVLIGLFVVIFKLGLKMPLRYFFGISSGLLYLLSFVLVGKGVREFQEAGLIGITPLQFIPNIDILGIYPTLQTTAPQAVLFFAFIFAIVWIFVITQERERKEIAVSVTKIAEDMKTMHEAFDHIKGHIVEWKRCEDIDLEAEDLDKQIHDVIDHVDELETKLVDFFDVVSKNSDDQIDDPPAKI
jgi:high-affinity iron transporter